MPYYHRVGQLPPKRHTQFRKPDGGLYAEQLFSTEGFSNDYSLLYHHHAPTAIIHTETPYSVAPEIAEEKMLQHRSFNGFSIAPASDYLLSRQAVLVNADCQLVLAAPQNGTTDYFYKNADADELLFVHEGSGLLMTMYGNLRFGYGDYLVIPRGTIYQVQFDGPQNRLLIVESFSPIRFPKKYCSRNGQLQEHAPFCERDLRVPVDLTTIDEKGDFIIRTKKRGVMYGIHYGHHPFDVVGWDGCCYPFAFSIHDFEPITGRVHQPPPVHQTFEGNNFVVCSFVPRLFDYHPGGIPHGPHPGAVLKSLGAKETKELAVMVDTFHPLQLTKAALAIENPAYTMSWVEE